MALQLVVVTGMSGAGRSTALRVLEDLGHFCVDNIPPALIPQLIELLEKGGELTRVALGVDVRTGGFLEGATQVLDSLTASGHHVELLFLESQDAELVRRFSETRRAHPLAPGGNVLAAIQRERERVAPLRARAGMIIDTTGLSVHDFMQLTPSQRPAVVKRENGIPKGAGAPARDNFEVSTGGLQNGETAGVALEKLSRSKADDLVSVLLGSAALQQVIHADERLHFPIAPL